MFLRRKCLKKYILANLWFVNVAYKIIYTTNTIGWILCVGDSSRRNECSRYVCNSILYKLLYCGNNIDVMDECFRKFKISFRPGNK